MMHSRFNVQSHWVDGVVGVFNTQSLNFVALDQSEYADFSSCKDISGELKRLGFIVENRIGELSDSLAEYRQSKYSERKQLSVTVVPTLACNFACNYCSNGTRHRLGTPEKSTAAAIEYILTELRPGEQLALTWYGGEPLLVLDEIEAAMEQINAIASERGSKVVVDIVSNGYYLERRVLQRLDRLNVKAIQFSFDLPFSSSQRATKKVSAAGLVGKIVETINEFDCEIWYNFRFNCRPEFLVDIPHIVELFAGLKTRNRRIYLHQIFSNPQDNTSKTFSNAEEMTEFYQDYGKARQLLSSAGLISPRLPQSASSACMAARPDAGVFISPDGIRTCIREVSGPGARIVERTPNEIAKWYYEYEGFGGDECLRCPYLPVCGGGCPKDVREGLPVPLRCTSWRFTLVDELTLALEMHLRGEKHDYFAGIQLD